MARYQTFRSQIDIGDLADCADSVVVCNALIDFVRELPEPLIPYHFYERAISIVKEFLIESTAFACMLPLLTVSAEEEEVQHFVHQFLQTHPEAYLLRQVTDDMDIMFNSLWQGDQLRGNTPFSPFIFVPNVIFVSVLSVCASSFPFQRSYFPSFLSLFFFSLFFFLFAVEARPLVQALMRQVFTVRAAPWQLEPFWAALPRAHRNSIKLLGMMRVFVCLLVGWLLLQSLTLQ